MTATRRDFLKTLAMAPLGAAEPHLLPADVDTLWSAAWTGRSFRTAIIGVGTHGLQLLGGATRAGGCELVAICDVDRDRLRASRDLGFGTSNAPNRFVCHRDMLAATRPEIVIISSPDHWHFAHARDALAYGAHILMATPAALSVDGMRELSAFAIKKGCIASLAALPQTLPCWHTASKRLQNGQFGQPHTAHISLFYGRGQPHPLTAPVRPPRVLDWQRWCGPAGAWTFQERWRAGANGCGFLNQPAFSQGCLGRWGGPLLQWVLDATHKTPPTSSWALGTMVQGTAAFGFPGADTFQLSWQHQPALPECIPDGAYDAAISIATDTGRLCLLSEGGWSFFPHHTGMAGISMAGERSPEIGFARVWASMCRSVELGEHSPLNLQRMLPGAEASTLAMLSLRLKQPVSVPKASSSRLLDMQAWPVLAKASGRGPMLG